MFWLIIHTIVAKLRSWTFEEILADEDKGAQCAMIAESIELRCYAGLESGVLEPGLPPCFYLLSDGLV
jgi:hypothetical protein